MFAIFENITNWLWGLPLLITIIVTGVFLTVRTGFFQFRHFGYIVKNMFNKESRNGGKDDGKSLTPFQAISIAIGGTIGVSNMSGVATAVATGGPGALFWLFIAGLLGLTDEALILTTTVWVVIVMDIIMTFMGSTSNDAAFNAWLTDITTPKIRPKIETALTFVGFLSVAAVMGVGSLAQSGAVTYQAFFLVLGLIVALCGVAGLFLIKNPEYTSKENEVSSSYWADLFYGFRPSVIKNNARLYLTLLAIGFSSIAYQVFFPYLLVYLQYVVIPDNGDNLITTSVIITAALVIVALIAGFVVLLKVSAKNKAFGLVPCMILQTAGLLLLSTSTDIKVILIGVVPTLVGNLVMGIQLNAAIKDFIPQGKAGLFQGIRMIFTVLLPMVIGPALGDLACRNSAITYANEFGVETIVPSSSMFLYAAIVSVFVVIPMIFLIKKGFKVEE